MLDVGMDRPTASRDPTFSKRAPRIGLRLPATLVREDSTEEPVIVLDVSSGGFKLEVSQPPRIGEFVGLRVDKSGLVDAQIRWVLGAEAGGVFLSPVDYSEW